MRDVNAPEQDCDVVGAAPGLGALDQAIADLFETAAQSQALLDLVDPMRIATRTISGLYNGATTQELDQLSIQTASSLIAEEPQHSKLAARLLGAYVDKEVRNQDIHSFSQSIRTGFENGLISKEVSEFVAANSRKLDDAIDPARDDNFEYLGLRTVRDRYLLVNPETRESVETPQYFFMRVACGLSDTPQEAIEFYQLISSLEYLPSSPTLFNSSSPRSQLSSCYLLDSPEDDLGSIYERYKRRRPALEVRRRYRARLPPYPSEVARSSAGRTAARTASSPGSRRSTPRSPPSTRVVGARGLACVYLETWHADIEEFLELRDNTGDDARRTHNLNLANWVPDLFMQRVEGHEAMVPLRSQGGAPPDRQLRRRVRDRSYVEAEERAGLFERRSPHVNSTPA